MGTREERDDRREGRLVIGAMRMLGVLEWGEGTNGEKIWNPKFCENEC